MVHVRCLDPAAAAGGGVWERLAQMAAPAHRLRGGAGVEWYCQAGGPAGRWFPVQEHLAHCSFFPLKTEW